MLNVIKNYFESTQDVRYTASGEGIVCCPFHDDTTASASFSIEKNLFHCKAEDLGLNDVTFLAQLSDLPIGLCASLIDIDAAMTEVKNLYLADAKNKFYIDRKISEQTLRKLNIMELNGRMYVPFSLYGTTLGYKHRSLQDKDFRTTLGFPTGLFNYDKAHGYNYVVVVSGATDLMACIEHGINAVALTQGEGSLVKCVNAGWLDAFKDKTIILAMDNDTAGKNSNEKGAAALYMNEFKDIRIFKFDEYPNAKDLCDIHVAGLLREHVIMANAEKIDEKTHRQIFQNVYPAVDIDNVCTVHTHNRQFSSEMTFLQYGDAATTVMKTFVGSCSQADEHKHCKGCPFATGKTVTEDFAKGDDNSFLHELQACTTEQQNNKLKARLHIPRKCGVWVASMASRKSVYVDISTVYLYDRTNVGVDPKKMYLIGKQPALETNTSVRIYGHGHSDYATSKNVATIDRIQPTKDNWQSIKLIKNRTMNLHEMEKFYKSLAHNLVGKHCDLETLLFPVLIAYMSPLENVYGKGTSDVLIVGDTRTGKSETALSIKDYLSLGEVVNSKAASFAGLVGGVSSNGKERSVVMWGAIPRNHGKIVILEELSGMDKTIISQMTDVRSRGIATINKVVSREAPARTRLLAISNPRAEYGSSTSVRENFDGVTILEKLIGNAEDVARFDVISLIRAGEITTTYHFEKDMDWLNRYQPYFQSLVCFAWQRTAEQIKFDENTLNDVCTPYIEKYDHTMQLFGRDTKKKVLRIATSFAIMCHSIEGDDIIVQREHMDYAAQYLEKLYCNEVFRFHDSVARYRSQTIEVRQKDLLETLLSMPESHVLRTMDTVPAGNFTKETKGILMALTVSGEVIQKSRGFSLSQAARTYADQIYPLERLMNDLSVLARGGVIKKEGKEVRLNGYI